MRLLIVAIVCIVIFVREQRRAAEQQTRERTAGTWAGEGDSPSSGTPGSGAPTVWPPSPVWPLPPASPPMTPLAKVAIAVLVGMGLFVMAFVVLVLVAFSQWGSQK